MERTYVINIEETNIVADFHYPDVVVIAIRKIFGDEAADKVEKWLNTNPIDATYRDNEFYIHAI